MKSPSVPVFIGLGSNRGDKRKNIERAIALLSRAEGIAVRRAASLYKTEPVGGPRQSDYLNTVAELRVRTSPAELLAVLRQVEATLGRRRRVKWGPRTIDLDILTFGRRRLKSRGLTVPHPRYHRRRFVLVPFLELSPRLRHPVLGVENRALLACLTPLGQRVTIVGRWKNTQFHPFKRKKSTASPL